MIDRRAPCRPWGSSRRAFIQLAASINRVAIPARVSIWARHEKDNDMPLFTTDLYRNFGIGFLLGGIAVALTNPGLGHAFTTLFA